MQFDTLANGIAEMIKWLSQTVRQQPKTTTKFRTEIALVICLIVGIGAS